jgi:integrase
MRLDKNTVAALGLPEGVSDKIHFDSELSGFGYRVRRSAGGELLRSYIAQYRSGGASKRLLIGDAAKITCAQARELAKKALADVVRGEDPSAVKADRRTKDELRFSTLAARYIEARSRKLRPSSMRIIRMHLTGDYFAALHGMPIDTIKRANVAACLTAITSDAVRRQMHTIAMTFFAWCMTEGLIESNPVIGTARPDKAIARDRVLTDAELSAIWKACNGEPSGAQADHNIIVKLLMLLGCRREEVGGMRWDELSDGVWSLPAERSKNKVARKIILPAAALDLLDGVHRNGRDRVFGQRSATLGFVRWSGEKKKLDAACGVSGWHLHDIRRSMRSGLSRIGVLPHIAEEAIGHVTHKSGVVGVYDRHDYSGEVKTAPAMWADHLLMVVNGGERKVVPLRA